MNGIHPTMAAPVVPVTRVPALDTLDQYVVGKAVADKAAISPSVELTCSSDYCDIANSLIEGYARFISRLTGLEDVAFFVSRQSSIASESDLLRGVISASVLAAEEGQQSRCDFREDSEQHADEGEVQFSLDLGLYVGPENGEQQPLVGVPDSVSVLPVQERGDCPI